MRKFQSWSTTFLLSAALASPVLLTGCWGRVSYYDSSYGDYHPWNHNEAVYYSRWEGDTHREHMDFKRRSKDEQAEYWKWRHQQH